MSSEEAKKIIGTPINMGSYEVAQNDFREYADWDQAEKLCKSLGEGWRLPDKRELSEMLKSRDKIGNFLLGENYWSSSKSGWGGYYRAFIYSDNDGFSGQATSGASSAHYVRAVRSIE